MLRERCFLWVRFLPDAGLKEADEELSEIYEFYSPSAPPAKPLQPTPKSIPARVGATVVRPVFPVTDEE
jgi:hypothetical protein